MEAETIINHTKINFKGISCEGIKGTAQAHKKVMMC
jgi:hypothetical protein